MENRKPGSWSVPYGMVRTGKAKGGNMHKNPENQGVPYSTENAVLYTENHKSRKTCLPQVKPTEILTLGTSILTRKPYRLNNTEIVELENNAGYNIVQENQDQNKNSYSSIAKTRKTVGGVNFSNGAGVLTTTPLYRSWKMAKGKATGKELEFQVLGVPEQRKLAGTSLQGYMLENYTVAQINRIFRLLGVSNATVPSVEPEKVSHQWALEIRYKGENVLFSIYSYKGARWQVGGFPYQQALVLNFLREIGVIAIEEFPPNW